MSYAIDAFAAGFKLIGILLCAAMVLSLVGSVVAFIVFTIRARVRQVRRARQWRQLARRR